MLFNCKIIEVPGTITKASVLTPTQACSWAVVPPPQAVLRALLLQVRPACKGCNAPLKKRWHSTVNEKA